MPLHLNVRTQQVADLEQQVSDLNFYIKAQAKVQRSVHKADLQGGQVRRLLQH